MEWKPIDTMPTGLMCLVWRKGVAPNVAIQFIYQEGDGEYYLEFPGGDDIKPTHWAPITQPPAK